MLEAHVGFSTESNGQSAGRNIAKQALEGASTKPKLAILAVDSIARVHYNYGEVLNAVREELGPEVPLIGSTVNGIIVNDRFALKSAGILLLGGDFNVDAFFKFGKSRAEYTKIADEILRIKSQVAPNPNQLMFMFQDGMKFPPEMMAKQKMLNSRMVALFSGMVARAFKNQMDGMAEKGLGLSALQELILILYEKGWSIPIIGSLVMNLNYDNTAFFNGELLEDFVVGTILSGTNGTKFGCGLGAGGEATGVTCNITKNIGSFLLKINGKPAVKGFCDTLGIEMESLRELESFGYFNHYNIFGVREMLGGREILHPIVTQTNPDLENLIVSGFPFDKVPEKAEILRSSTQVLVKSAKDSIHDAMKDISEPKFLLGIDCALRFLAYGEKVQKEIDVFREAVGKDVPRFIIGSGGEIFGTQPKGFYYNNYSLVTFVGGQ